MRTIFGFIAITLMFIVQVPFYLWAKARRKKYQWWGGPQ